MKAQRKVASALMHHETGRDHKHTKREANYGPGMPKAHCGICEHFEEPNRCELVEGNIAPDMWCRYFEKD